MRLPESAINNGIKWHQCVPGGEKGETVDGGEKLFMDLLGNFFSMTDDDDDDGKKEDVSGYFPFLFGLIFNLQLSIWSKK